MVTHFLPVVRMWLPGGLQHSSVALADVLLQHDRGDLLSVLEDFFAGDMRHPVGKGQGRAGHTPVVK